MSVIRALVLVALLATTALAQPRRVLVIDADRELVHALESSLAPWRLVVVADPAARTGPRTHSDDPQFVVWREGSTLVVYDRARGTTERRPLQAGALDAVTAAGAALTVKTMMRLPADPDAPLAPRPRSSEAIGVRGTAAVVPETPTLRVHGGIGGHVAGHVGGHATLALMARPLRELRVGAAVEFASGEDFTKGTIHGQTSQLAVLALASWSIPVRSFVFEPMAGLGFTRTRIEGGMVMPNDDDDDDDGPMAFDDRAYAPILRAGVIAWYPLGAAFAVGGAAALDLALGTDTYTRNPGNAVVYETPLASASLTLLISWSR